MGFFSSIKKFFGAGDTEAAATSQPQEEQQKPGKPEEPQLSEKSGQEAGEAAETSTGTLEEHPAEAPAAELETEKSPAESQADAEPEAGMEASGAVCAEGLAAEVVEEPAEGAAPAEVEVSAETEDQSALEEPAEAAAPAEGEVSAETEDQSALEEPAEAAAPAEVEVSAETEDQSALEEPVEAAAPAEVEVSAETEDQSALEEPVEAAAPAEVEMSAETEVQSALEEPEEGAAPAEVEVSAEAEDQSALEEPVEAAAPAEVEVSAETEDQSALEEPVEAAAPAEPASQTSGGFFASLKRFFGGGESKSAKSTTQTADEAAPAEPVYGGKPQEKPVSAAAQPGADAKYQELTRRLRDAEPRLSTWLEIVLEGVHEAGSELNDRIRFLLRSLEAPANEIDAFIADFSGWTERMEYRQLDEFRSELQYRLSLALDLEDEEDERNRLILKLTDSLAKTRAQFARHFDGLISSHGELDEDFWEELEELFIMSDLGVEAAVELTSRLRVRARAEKVTTTEGARDLLRKEVREIFVRPRHIVGVNPPEVVLMIGVNGAGKTTTIAKLAYRDRMQGKKVMIAAADTFRAAAIDQMRVWSERVGTLFHAKQPGSDPASVAYEAMDRALAEGVDVLYVDTAGRLQTKVNLMDELAKIRNVIARKHPGAPHRTVLVLDATTGQNALSQARLFKESAGVDELILTKLDGTAKGGVAIAVAMQHKLPISYVGLGEKVEDLRPFNGDDYADALFKS